MARLRKASSASDSASEADLFPDAGAILLLTLFQAFISEPLVLPNWLDVHGVRPGEVVDEAEGHQPHHDDQHAPVRLPRTGSAAARTGREPTANFAPFLASQNSSGCKCSLQSIRRDAMNAAARVVS